jgi:Zn-finger nucleic acid-binding protein
LIGVKKCKGTWLDGGELAQFANIKSDLPNAESMVSYEKKIKIELSKM